MPEVLRPLYESPKILAQKTTIAVCFAIVIFLKISLALTNLALIYE